ncbi:MAG: metal-dependent hydrolase [Deltaproteobacteria bacterium]
MASIGHLVASAAATRLYGPSDQRVGRTFLFLTALSFLPDLDVVAFAFGIPYAHDFGHRGATHSFAFAIIVGCITWAWGGRQRLAVAAGLVTASHAVLDAFTDGGLGVALLWPLSSERFFFPWRPLPVAPIGHHFLSGRGLTVALTEVLLLSPLIVYAVWPLVRSKWRSAVAR